jgi:hypothetical protein
MATKKVKKTNNLFFHASEISDEHPGSATLQLRAKKNFIGSLDFKGLVM